MEDHQNHPHAMEGHMLTRRHIPRTRKICCRAGQAVKYR